MWSVGDIAYDTSSPNDPVIITDIVNVITETFSTKDGRIDVHEETIIHFCGFSNKEVTNHFELDFFNTLYEKQEPVLYTVLPCPHEKVINVGFHFDKNLCTCCGKEV